LTVLCIHRQEPNWKATPDRPRFVVSVDKATYWVETDGKAPTVAEVRGVLFPPPPPEPTPAEKLARAGLTVAELKELLK
jgi:hypothetical protein